MLFGVSLNNFCVVSFLCAGFNFFTTKPRDWEEHCQNNLFCVAWNVKPYVYRYVYFVLQGINTVYWTWCMDGASDESTTNRQRRHDSIADICWTFF